MKSIKSILDVEILMRSSARCDRSWNFHFANTPFARFYNTISGEGYFSYNGREYHLRPGFIHLIPSGADAETSCPEFMEQEYVHFHAEIFGSIDVFRFFPCRYEVDISKERHLEVLWERFFSLSDLQGLDGDGIMRILCSSFINTESDGILPGMTRFIKAFDYIEKNLHRRLNLKNMAKTMNLQPTYFSNLFCASFGMPPMAFLRKRRIEKAQMLLLSGDEKLDKIAENTGFDDVFHFSRTFKKVTGIPPSVYRKNREYYLR